jgi:hypothetical protein
VITGVVGSIRWHYYTAAAINGFTVTPLQKDRSRWSLRATVVLSDSFKMAQRPLTFVATLRNGQEWTWPITAMRTETLSGVPVLVAELGREVHDVPIRPT